MHRTFHPTPRGIRRCCMIPMFALAMSGTVLAAATLPDTPVGKLGGQLLQHVNEDSPDQLRRWTAAALSPAMPAGDRAAFASTLAAAARDAGGLDVFDVRTDPRRPGMLQVAVGARRSGKRGLLVLAADPGRPGKLELADLMPMEDPSIYAGWPDGAVSGRDLGRLLHATLDRLVRSDDFSGCVTVSDGSAIFFDECRGLAERRFGVPVGHDTRFRIGSIGKMFTAVGIAQLVEAGRLSWNDTLAQLVPGYGQGPAAKITVWQLLHHTSGLGDMLVPEYFEHRERYIDPADYLDLIARQPRPGEPGKGWIYSNSGYVLLGYIIGKVSGENYFDYIRDHVFAPAGMHDSGFDDLREPTPRLSTGYFHDSVFATDWKADWLAIPVKGSPAGGAYSTNADLLRFADALRGGKLVASTTLARMFDDEVPAGPGSYAAGFGDRLSSGRHIRGHAGGIEGTDANLQMVWETGAAVALTSNEGPGQYWMLAERIADLLAAANPKP